LNVFKNEISTFLDASIDASKGEKQEIPNAPVLSLYAKNLNNLARAGKIDPLVCRDDELQRLIQVLCRRTKNNPCLIGEPGVGKTAIVEGLALKIVNGDVPDVLDDKIVACLDLSSMIAGAKYRGEFEERMKGILAEIRASENLILFIDEIHTLVGAGAAEGAVDAANIIKPALARSNLQLIGATTTTEYRKYIEKDPALERRFQPIMINEPSKKDAYKMLIALKPKYEEHHGVLISNEAIDCAIELSVRYINDRYLPDKAIDLIDEACSYVKMRHFEKPSRLKEYEKKLHELDWLKEKAILDGDFNLASLIRDDEIINQIEYNKSKDKHIKKLKATQACVSPYDIKIIVEKWTGVPLCSTNGENLSNLESVLLEKIVGQNDAVKRVASSIKRGRVGLKNPNRPIGSFLFLGPTGVGKTELAKALSTALFGSDNSLTRIDMSEYMEKHSVSRLIGAPSGYVGYEDGGILTEAVRKRPYSVILFDELEKAHHDVYNILLQILDDGILTDSFGRTVDFKNTIIILTSNIGASSLDGGRSLGFSNSDFDANEHIKEALKKELSPEFINRIDEIVIFNQLSKNDIEKIAYLMMNEIKALALDIGIELEFDSEAVGYISGVGYNKSYGARQLRRTITRLIENELSELILNGEIKSGQGILISGKNGKIEFLHKEKSTSI
jgi:ATP-dependent Clp protease ATP-binding subunit ClpC